MDDELRKYFWLGALVVATLLLMDAALQANRLAVNAVKRRQTQPSSSVIETNKGAHEH